MEERLVQALSERIRALREASPWSQEDFAAHAGLDRSYYARLERGRLNPSWVMIVRVAAGLELQPWQLMEGLKFDTADVRAMPRRTRAVPGAPSER